MKNVDWTEERIAELLHLNDDEKLSFTQIGLRMGLTRGQVSGKLDRLLRKRERVQRKIVERPTPRKGEEALVRAVDHGETPGLTVRTTTLDRRSQKDKRCAWPVGDPRDAGLGELYYHTCHRSRVHENYCDLHHKMAYPPAVQHRRRRAFLFTPSRSDSRRTG